MRNVTPETITKAFAAYATEASNPRAREVLNSLAKHLHAFVVEVRLTHAEWRAGLDGLARSGEITEEGRDEFVLLSDLLGVTALVDMINTHTISAVPRKFRMAATFGKDRRDSRAW